MVSLFTCSECQRSYVVRIYRSRKRKTSLCKSCLMKSRNRTAAAREVSRKIGKLRPTEAAKEKMRESRKRYYALVGTTSIKGENNPAWKGGTVIANGYKLVRAPDHPKAVRKGLYVQEHILVMEQFLGRYLLSDEVVHHKNGNRSDNRLENLEVMSQAEHVRLHTLGRKKK